MKVLLRRGTQYKQVHVRDMRPADLVKWRKDNHKGWVIEEYLWSYEY